jgi:SAM-dependent methyltransferase
MKTFVSRDKRRLYNDLAWTWPIISPPESYVDETGEVIRLIKKYALIPVNRVINFGCGGGHNDHTLKRHFQVTGVDISENMLSLARALNPEVTYVPGDMRAVRLGDRFDAVTIFDAISYMRTIESLRAAFNTAFSHLRPGGVFVTSVEECADDFRQNKTYVHANSRDDIEITLIDNYYDPDPNDTWYECHLIYLIRQRGELTIETDCHLLGLFPLRTWLDEMAGAGFIVHRHQSSVPNDVGEFCPILIGVKPK